MVDIYANLGGRVVLKTSCRLIRALWGYKRLVDLSHSRFDPECDEFRTLPVVRNAQ